MKYLKMLGLAAVAAAALMAFVGSSTASATVLCKTEGIKNGGVTGTTCPPNQAYPAGTTIHASLEAGTKAKLKTEFKTIECGKSTIHGSTNTEGGEGLPVTGPEGTLTFEECNCEVKVLHAGTLSTQWIPETHNGTMTSSGSESTTTCSTIFGNVHCIYVTEGNDLGELTGGAMATVDAHAEIPRLPTNGLCSAEALWEAKYTVTEPEPLWVTGET
jgi:hypothetical protein